MAEACHYPDFWWRDHYLPQMPLLFCVSICPEANIPTKEQEVPLCGRTPDLSNQLAALPSHESLRLCLKAIHLLLRGCVAVGECARVQVGISLCARACREWEVAENMWFVALRVLTPLLPEVQLARSLEPWNWCLRRKEVTNKCGKTLGV